MKRLLKSIACILLGGHHDVHYANGAVRICTQCSRRTGEVHS